MNTLKVCSVCGTKKGRIIFSKKRYLCNRHHIQFWRYGRFFERTRTDKNEIILCKDFAIMKLYDYKGKIKREIQISFDSVEKIKNIRWFCYGEYVACYNFNDVKNKNGKIFLHHFLMGKREKKMVIDHINGNKYDNRIENLKYVSYSENNLNRKEICGIYWDKKNKKWAVRIEKNKKVYWLGRHKNFEDAVKIRAKAEINLIGRLSIGTQNVIKKFDRNVI